MVFPIIERVSTETLVQELIRRGAQLPVKIEEPLKVLTVVPEPEEEPSEIWEFDLDTDRNYELIKEIAPGDFILASTDGTLAGISIRVGLTQSAGGNQRLTWYLDEANEIRRSFKYVFLKNNVQAGKKLRLEIGREALAVSAVRQTTSAELKNKVSAVLDSTTANLADGATYTGAAFSVEEYGYIVGSVYSDRNGTLYVEQTEDGVNYDIQETLAYVAGALQGWYTPVLAPNARVRFTNAAGAATTTFRLVARARRV